MFVKGCKLSVDEILVYEPHATVSQYNLQDTSQSLMLGAGVGLSFCRTLEHGRELCMQLVA